MQTGVSKLMAVFDNYEPTDSTQLLNENIDYDSYSFSTYNEFSLGEAARLIDHDHLNNCCDIDNGRNRLVGYRTYRDWYNGKHNAQVSDRQRELYERAHIQFADNFIDTIVDTLVRRLKLKTFSYQPENESANEETTTIMRKNVMDILANRVHHVSAKCGDSFVICDYDDVKQVPTITYNRPEIIRPEYDDDTGERMLWVSKCWRTEEVSPFNPGGEEIERLNIYYPNRIEKYYREVCEGKDDQKTWLPFMDISASGKDELWPVPWVDESTGEPLGIPVFHFKNKTLDGRFGISEIKKAIPQQAMLNKALLDLDLILDNQGWPQRWASGVGETENENPNHDGNNQAMFDGQPGSVWHTMNDQAKFGQFESAPVEGALKAIEMLTQHISATNATPIWLLLSAGRFPSGESMKMGDSGLSDKAAERALIFGNTWENVIRYCHKLRNIRGEAMAYIDLEDTEIECIWEDTVPRNEKVTVEVLSNLVELGASKRWALEQYGIDNVDDVMQEAELEKEVESERAIRSITRGNPIA